jgi:hypothetical protein
LFLISDEEFAAILTLIDRATASGTADSDLLTKRSSRRAARPSIVAITRAVFCRQAFRAFRAWRAAAAYSASIFWTACRVTPISRAISACE